MFTFQWLHSPFSSLFLSYFPTCLIILFDSEWPDEISSTPTCIYSSFLNIHLFIFQSIKGEDDSFSPEHFLGVAVNATLVLPMSI